MMTRTSVGWLARATISRHGSASKLVRCAVGRQFADGRLYHPVVAEKVVEAWNSTRLNRWGRECDRIRKENKARAERRESPLEFPSKPTPIPNSWPEEGESNSDKPSAGIPTETGRPSAG